MPQAIKDENKVQDKYSQVAESKWDGGILKCPMLQAPNHSMKNKK